MADPPLASAPVSAIGDPDLWQVEYVQIQMPVGDDGGCLHLTITRAGQAISERHDKLCDPLPDWRASASECKEGWRAEIAVPVAHAGNPRRFRFARWVPEEGITRWPTPFGSWWHVDGRDFLEASDAGNACDVDAMSEEFLRHRENEMAPMFQSRLVFDVRPWKAFGELPPPNIARCDEMLLNRFCFENMAIEIGTPPDWDSPRGDLYTMQHVTRFDFLAELVAAYRTTQDLRYARKAVECVETWLAGYDVRQSLTPRRYSIRWFPILMSHRLVCMVRTLFSLLSTGLVREELLAALYRTVAEVAFVLNDRVARSYPKNHSLIVADHMVQLSVLCDELECAGWIRQTYFEHFRRALQTQFLPDDVQWELSPCYHMVCYQRLTEATNLCAQAGIEVPGDITDWRRRILTVAARYRLPNGEVAAFNDGTMAGHVDAIGRPDDTFTSILEREAKALGVNCELSPPFSHAMPYAGHFILRDGAARTSMALAFDAGPFGMGHQHEDALGIILACHGKTLLHDIGSGSYNADDPMRAYSTSTESHSTICVNGQPQAARAFPAQWKRDAPWAGHHYFGRSVQFVEGEYRLGYGAGGAIPVTHRRAILFVNHAFVVVLDLLDGDGEHRIESHFAVAPMPYEQTADGLRTTSGNGDLDIRLVHPRAFEHRVVVDQKAPLAGLMPDGRPHPRLTFQLRERMPCCLITLLTPFPDPSRIANVEAEQRGPTLHVVMTSQDMHAELTCAREPLALQFCSEHGRFEVSTVAEGTLAFSEQQRCER